MGKLLFFVSVLLSACAVPVARMSSDSVVPIVQVSITDQASEWGSQASFEGVDLGAVGRAGSTYSAGIRSGAGTMGLGSMHGSYAGDGMPDADLRLGGRVFAQGIGVHTERSAESLTARSMANAGSADLYGLSLEMRAEEFGAPGIDGLEGLILPPMAADLTEWGPGDFGLEASYGFPDVPIEERGGGMPDPRTRLSFGVQGTGIALDLGYQAVRVRDTRDTGGESAAFDAVFGGPYLGFSISF